MRSAGRGGDGMTTRGMIAAGAFAWLLALPAAVLAAPLTESLTIGDTFTLPSKVLDETRRINVFTPTVYGDPVDAPLPVIYMPDGGIHEDFLHIAGLVQVSVSNGTMRPFRLVGIENTQRRRDLTGPTEDPEDRKIAPEVGGSAKFRKFLADELIPEIERRYETTGERVLIGESLAGLFTVETMLLAPELFDTFIAIDPSLWWNRASLATRAAEYLDGERPHATLFVATSDEPVIVEPVRRFVEALDAAGGTTVQWQYVPMPHEGHGTIYHPAALAAFRAVLAPPKTGEE